MPLSKIQTGSVKKKILFIFLIFTLALFLAYIISNAAFKDMLLRVDKMSSPDEKIVLVNQISQEIMLLDRVQREQMLADSNPNLGLLQDHHTNLNDALERMRTQFVGNALQLSRIDSIQVLLQNREEQVHAYIAARRHLDNNPVVKKEIQALGQLIESDSLNNKSRGVNVSEPPLAEKKEERKRGFLGWLFGSKKKNPEDDTLPIAPNLSDSIVEDSGTELHPEVLDHVIQRIQDGQNKSVNELILRDMDLLHSGNILLSQVLDILQVVEQEALRQAGLDTLDARNSVQHSVNRIVFVFVIFLLVIAIMIYFILSDIRKSNNYRVALEEAKEVAEYHAVAKQKFLSNMSHELRTPLQSIIGFAEQLKNRYTDDDMVKTIQQSSEHLLYIVNEVLDFNRIDSGKIVLKEQPLNLEEIVTDVIQTIEPLIVQKNLKLEHRVDLERFVWVLGDAFRIRQILFNLLSNAIKFTNEGKIVLEVSGKIFETSKANLGQVNKSLYLEIKVTDTGIGIVPRDLERIFDHFEQVEDASQSPQAGSGLGLSIVKGILGSMGGEVFVQSQKDKGSIFTAKFPLKIYHEQRAKKDTKEQPAWVQENVGKVWLVDDDLLIRQLCQTIFERKSILYKIFSSPEDILNEPYDPDVKTILMDIRMPKMNGFSLSRKLRANIALEHIQIIAFTAQALPEEQSMILGQGFDGILLKPFREVDLLHALGMSALNKENQDKVDFDQKSPDILAIFVQETKDDLDHLKEDYQKKDLSSMSLIFHRLAGRISQFGGHRLAITLRKHEIDTRAEEFPDINNFEKIVKEIEDFIEHVSV